MSITLDFSMPITYLILLCVVIALLDLILYIHKKTTENKRFKGVFERKTAQQNKKGVKQYPFHYNGVVWMEGINKLNAHNKFLNFKKLQEAVTKKSKENGEVR